jgi:hypothetical protein
MSSMTPSVPDHVNPIQWHQAVAVSRQTCARVFRDGGSPAEALAAFGIAGSNDVAWEKAVDLIAAELCAHPLPKAA